jgi:hypothetical protein
MLGEVKAVTVEIVSRALVQTLSSAGMVLAAV